MAERKHTPGPWAWYDDALYRAAPLAAWRAWVDQSDDDGAWESGPDLPRPIVETDGGVYGPRGADRSLIAAAPDLLAALKDAREFIASDYQSHDLGYWPEVATFLARLDAAIRKAEGQE